MNTATAPNLLRPPTRHPRPRQRPDLPALTLVSRPHVPSSAAHDFLVPNPRPDLTLDPHTLRMLDNGRD